MRNLLLLLLLANILYFIWQVAAEEAPEQGVEILDRSELGPRLPLADGRTVMAMRAAAAAEAEAEAKVDADGEADADGGAGPATLPAVIGNACVSIGPFANSAEAERALAGYRNAGMRGIVRTTEGQLFVGHWVQITNIPTREIGDAMLKKLVAGGLSDAYLIPSDEDGLKISLGLFGDRDRAARVAQEAEALNIPAEVTPRMRDAMVFYVDLELPPGRGATEMIERFGEEKVLLRERASCPTG
ncbi:MAG TPA: SPOR domain-containing protein [Woeseiaceae bacterium]